jgi:hypothetical protein
MYLQARPTPETPLFDRKGAYTGLSGPGPYRWCHVVRTEKGLALGNIYRKLGDDLTEAEVMWVKECLAKAKYEVVEFIPPLPTCSQPVPTKSHRKSM